MCTALDYSKHRSDLLLRAFAGLHVASGECVAATVIIHFTFHPVILLHNQL